jgi:hypothetical protein
MAHDISPVCMIKKLLSKLQLVIREALGLGMVEVWDRGTATRLDWEMQTVFRMYMISWQTPSVMVKRYFSDTTRL